LPGAESSEIVFQNKSRIQQVIDLFDVTLPRANSSPLSPSQKTFRPVVLNRVFESRMRLPSTHCAALSSFSMKPLIFSVTDFGLP